MGNKLRKTFFWIHKWLGLATGIVVFLVSISGCVYVFQDELKLWFYPEKYFIEAENTHAALQPLSRLILSAESALGSEEKVSRVDLYPDPHRTWVFRASKTDEEAFGHWNYQVYNKRIFIDPYSGKIQAIENSKTEFFQVALQLHMNLLLGKRIGQPIVAYSTVVFMILLISGLWLWWPKNWTKRSLKQGLKLDFKRKWKRINYDLHNVLGFYAFAIALVFCVTGLVFAFPKFKTAYVERLNKWGEGQVQNKEKDDVPIVPQTSTGSLDNALVFAIENYPQADMMSIRLRDSTAEFHDIQIRLAKNRTGKFKWYYFNQQGGQIAKIKSNEGLLLGDRLATLNYDLHTGAVGAWFTKVLAFFAALVSASLPITGFLMWWNKNKKKV
ncbi:PepSY domain-containing protein [Marinilongibacter aquaticus]|uniref:PepSY-associated TM helix domain-containing protein n=1 Tax=Marinilongibacter aquaticus TaxID=2975157 RepID=UPI0021BDBBF8|nr:PepSY-associated TM helix domain-containing protein [Marinilongibacter aquaticus]UBM60613.1 PepSY domain-containing protein [Marinilongibacter aquaticus]